MISLIIPVYNEEKSLKNVIEQSKSVLLNSCGANLYEIIVVNDGSTDSSAQIAKAQQVTVINHQRRKGVGAARTTGMRQARGDKILFIDADMSYNPEDFSKIIKELQTYDMVVGAREREMGSLPALRASIKYFFKTLASLLSRTSIPDLNSGLRGMDKQKAIEFQYLLPTGHSWVSTITLCFLGSGYSVHFVPIAYDKRLGRSTFNIVNDTYSLFLTIIKTIIYFYPLRVIMPISLGIFIVGLLFLLRDIMQCDIADTTVLLIVLGIVTFVFALVSEQLACLRREINQKMRT